MRTPVHTSYHFMIPSSSHRMTVVGFSYPRRIPNKLPVLAGTRHVRVCRMVSCEICPSSARHSLSVKGHCFSFSLPTQRRLKHLAKRACVSPVPFTRRITAFCWNGGTWRPRISLIVLRLDIFPVEVGRTFPVPATTTLLASQHLSESIASQSL